MRWRGRRGDSDPRPEVFHGRVFEDGTWVMPDDLVVHRADRVEPIGLRVGDPVG